MKLSSVRFLEVEEVIAIHTAAIGSFGGSYGTRDAGLLVSAVMAARSGYYRSLAEIAAVYLHGLAKNHPFVDGNKRTAMASCAAFLGIHGFALRLDADKWETIVVGVATDAVTRDELVAALAVEIGDPCPFDE